MLLTRAGAVNVRHDRLCLGYRRPAAGDRLWLR